MSKTIYLASDSKARKKLLEIFGLKFRVLSVRIKEKKGPGKLSYAGLVKVNALTKARSAAKKVKNGIIIAADTICVQEGKIFGKPRDLSDAKRMLKKLSQKPQWLYTGLAVIDKTRGKVLLDYEKTKVYMDKLSGKEIDNYFKKVSPMNKAGSFDIQGRGAFFIRRIEGCFYNVVGLPLRRLYLMLKKLDIKILVFFLSPTFYILSTAFLSGCSTEYNVVTGKQEVYYYSTDKEVQMGQAIAKAVEKEYKSAEDPLMQKRVEDIGKKVAVVSDRREIDYHFMVLDDDEVNAVSLPGGYVYVNKGLVEKVSNDDELAGVLAHEVGHIVARHSIKKLQGMQAYSILRILVAVAPGSGEVGNAADVAFTELLLGYSREDELLADQLGARYAKLAGYDPHGMITFLEKLQAINRKRPLQERSYFKTHPYVPDRVRVVKQELGEGIGFEDYINIEQETHK
ncbi:MAG: Maf family nucleotide pyrophosphatase [Candidatus Omnitrophica bacterium]|nr:Maf family nucleotide pyrophosphatase [Candidatus Omnitrophota bacterium]